MPVLVRFEGDQGWLEFRLDSYEFPDEKSGSDANWVSGELVAFHPGIGESSRSLPVYFRTEELAGLGHDLEALSSGEEDRITTTHFEEQFGQTFEVRDGSIWWSFWLSDHQGWKASTGAMKMDMSQVRTSITALAVATKEFPVRGERFP